MKKVMTHEPRYIVNNNSNFIRVINEHGTSSQLTMKVGEYTGSVQTDEGKFIDIFKLNQFESRQKIAMALNCTHLAHYYDEVIEASVLYFMIIRKNVAYVVRDMSDHIDCSEVDMNWVTPATV